jgi:hypothetical protein
VADSEDDDLAVVVIDAVKDSVGSPTGAPHTLQLVPKWSTDPFEWSNNAPVMKSMTANATDSGRVSRIARAAGAVTISSYRASFTAAGGP